jgi:glycosyltransferase involved in cell wall biosynthesis
MSSFVSAIIPVYNCECYLAAAIESVLEQTYPVHEIIVVDDGSTDDSCAIASQFPGVKLINRPHQGLPATRNVGIQQASGEFIAFLDSDDLWLPRKLEQQMQAFAAQPELDLVFSHIQQFISPDLDPAIQKTWRCPTDPMPGISATTIVARKSVFQQVGWFNSDLQIGEFIGVST